VLQEFLINLPYLYKIL